MVGVNVGPTVAQYTLRPSSGVKLSKITTLDRNLALAQPRYDLLGPQGQRHRQQHDKHPHHHHMAAVIEYNSPG